MNVSEPLRVVIQQPSLAKYRVPVYRRLAAEPGLDLTLVYGQDPGIPNVEPDGFAARFEPHRHLGPFVWSTPQLRHAGRRDLDVLVMVWNSRWLSLPLALRRARRRGIRTVVWGHGYSKDESPRRAALRKRIGLMADAMLFYSHTVADRYRADGVDPEKIFVAPNALDQAPIQRARDAWLADPARLQSFRQRHNVPLDTEPILYVSRLDPANRLDLLLQAAAKLIPSRPRLRVHLVGRGEDETLRLRRLAEDLGVIDYVRFLGPIYGEDDLAPWFLTARVFCYPANIGLSLHHAMGYGLPVVTADQPDAQNPEFEALRPGDNGAVYPPGDVQSLADTLRAYLEDDIRRVSAATEAHRTATERYDLDTMTRGYVDALRVHPPAVRPA